MEAPRRGRWRRRPQRHCPAERLERRVLLASIVVSELADVVVVDGRVTLREAIESANANVNVNADVAASGAYGGDSITFSLGLVGTITLAGVQLRVSDDLTITGPGAKDLAVSGNDASRVFLISGPTSDVQISGLTITRGKVQLGGTRESLSG